MRKPVQSFTFLSLEKNKKKVRKDMVYYKSFQTDDGNVKKIGVTNSIADRLSQLQKSGVLRNGKVIYSCVIEDAYKAESELHKKYKKQQVFLSKKTDGGSELFAIPNSQDAEVIKSIKSYSIKFFHEDYDDENVFYLRLAFIAPIVIYFLILYLK
jgi:hypothetical protein